MTSLDRLSALALTCACLVFSLLWESKPAMAYDVSVEGPASQGQYTETDYAGADAGYVVLSISVNDSGVGFRQLYLDAENANGTVRTAFQLSPDTGLFSHKNDFVDGKIMGSVIVRALRPGNYELTRFLEGTGDNCGYSSVMAAYFHLPFTVTPGKVTYLGNFRYEPFLWANTFGAICTTGGYFVVTDQSARDVALAKVKQAALPTDLQTKLPDFAALKLPLFQPTLSSAPQQSPTSRHSATSLYEAYRLVFKDKDKAQQLLVDALASGDLWQTDQAFAHSWLGVIAIENRDRKTAITELDEAIRLDPAINAAWGDRGIVKVELGDIEGAFADVNMALELAPRNANWHMAMGDIELARSHPDLAMVAYDDAISLAPGSGAAYISRARGNVFLKRYDAALTDIDNGVKADGFSQAEGYAFRCAISLRAGRADDAMAECDKGVKADPKDPFPLSVRGYQRLSANHPAAALEDFNAALALKIGSAFALYGRGLARQKTGDDTGGKDDIAAARNIDPGIDERAASYGVPPAGPDSSAPQ
jgi:tetratricopeptide (TPR) repeat protein